MQRVVLIISGNVQGVGYRAFVLRQAQNLRCIGWVKNRQDGSVEVVAEGPKGKLEELVRACKRGPEVALVDKVGVTWKEATGEFSEFAVVY